MGEPWVADIVANALRSAASSTIGYPPPSPAHARPAARPPGCLASRSAHSLHLYESSTGPAHRLLIGPDLGHLLGCCTRVALRHGTDLVVLEAEEIIRWRVLQVITAIPHLPSSERLNQLFPGAQLDASGFRVGIEGRAPEHVLVECLTHGIQVRESRILYSSELSG